jgi:hypothetical protein
MDAFITGFIKGAREAARVYFAPLFAAWRLLVSAKEWLLKRLLKR